MDLVDTVLRYVVVPICAFVWIMYQRQQEHNTQIAVLKTEVEMARLSYDREIREIKSMLQRILQKLDEKVDKR